MNEHPGLKKIRLNLARTKEYPNGSASHGYEFTAPLDDTGHIDAAVWKKERDHCRVRRFWGDEEEEIGHLVHRPGGSWAFRYDIEGDDDDEAGYRFGIHAFNPGEYVSIKDEDGDLYTFQVVTVQAI
ncbi:hypothetical protein JM93_02090 [Roseibium hamelinense]|uniref:Uncharacterized protein n=1 Tax=Roseibium hamelinense TaxID=150831 RepID=A0A562T2S3_9HYPH|nr:hypothetical protein [Roseibium hamelinense]MTI43325.1 hypothetical protein [Roseibium hamelinense]TWI87524.1 hypothetical protein JM93_02090 [Roseibium hamelinense]